VRFNLDFVYQKMAYGYEKPKDFKNKGQIRK